MIESTPSSTSGRWSSTGTSAGTPRIRRASPTRWARRRPPRAAAARARASAAGGGPGGEVGGERRGGRRRGVGGAARVDVGDRDGAAGAEEGAEAVERGGRLEEAQAARLEGGPVRGRHAVAVPRAPGDAGGGAAAGG